MGRYQCLFGSNQPLLITLSVRPLAPVGSLSTYRLCIQPLLLTWIKKLLHLTKFLQFDILILFQRMIICIFKICL